MKFLLSKVIALIFLSACSQKKPYTASIFEKEAVEYLSSHYELDKKEEYKVFDKDSLRGEQFYSADLQRAKMYAYKKVLDSNRNTAFIIFTTYIYSKSEIASKIVSDFQKEKDRRTADGFYGPLGKEYQCFFQANNLVIHLEATCKFVNENQLVLIQDSLIGIAGKHYGKVPIVVTKPCE